jgi:hypothetical protein
MIKTGYYTILTDGGDGSASTTGFKNKEDAEKALKLLEEKMPDDVYMNEGSPSEVTAYESYDEWYEDNKDWFED